MKITTILPTAAVVAQLQATDKAGVLTELSQALAGAVDGVAEHDILHALLEREKLGSTSIGRGVAIPHAKMDGLPRMFAAFGRSSRGIAFDSPDGRPTYLFFLLLAPGQELNNYLAALDRVSKLMWREENRQALLSADDGDVIEVLGRIDKED